MTKQSKGLGDTISKITKDFIEVIEKWKQLNMVIAGDFIVMASTLMRVKAKMMIPANRMTMIQLVDAGVPIETLTRTITFTGFTQGKFTPDIAELLNPVVAGFIAIQADKAGITPRMLNNPPKTSIEDDTVFEIMKDLNPERYVQLATQSVEEEEQEEQPTTAMNFMEMEKADG